MKNPWTNIESKGCGEGNIISYELRGKGHEIYIDETTPLYIIKRIRAVLREMVEIKREHRKSNLSTQGGTE